MALSRTFGNIDVYEGSVDLYEQFLANVAQPIWEVAMQDKGKFAEGGRITVLNDAQLAEKAKIEAKYVKQGLLPHEAAEKAMTDMSKTHKLEIINPKGDDK